MALIKCPECGNEISNRAPACIFCGYPIQEKQREDVIYTAGKSENSRVTYENDISTQNTNLEITKSEDVEKPQEKNKNPYNLIIICCIIAIALIASFAVQGKKKIDEQTSLAKQSITYYNSQKYENAFNILESLDRVEILGDYALPITLMGNIEKYLNSEGKELSATFYYLGHYKEFLSTKLDDRVYPQIIKAAQKVANGNAIFIDNVEYYANREYEKYEHLDIQEDKRLSDLLEPLLTEDRELLFKVANTIDSKIDYELAQKEYESFKEAYRKELEKQAQEEYDRNNPVQVSDKDAYPKGNYWYCVGSVRNISNTTRYYVRVKVTYMDENKEVLTTDWTYAVSSEGIRGGENQQFEIMTKVQGDVEYYRVEVLDWQ